jgi:toxin YoeB
MKKVWEDSAWDDYLYWQQTDKKMLNKVNDLIKSFERTPFSGIGKPEPLKENLKGFWSRKIDNTHRLVYKVENDILIISQCRFHY